MILPYEDYEAAIRRAGGSALASAVLAAQGVQGSSLDASDARQDAATLREEAVFKAGLEVGAAVALLLPVAGSDALRVAPGFVCAAEYGEALVAFQKVKEALGL